MSIESKKNAYSRNNYNLSKNNESTSLDSLQEKIEIEDSVYEHFIDELTLFKFNLFSSFCKEKEIDNLKHDMKLKKFQFIQIMKNVFPGITEFYPLYEKIFNRFKLLKCKILYNPLYDNYFINGIYSNEEIDIYEISCALACFIKCFFTQKLKILFDLSDTDEDGFINEKELKKMIYTINYLFNKEQNSIGIDSTITYLSLASIKAKKSFNLIMDYPGNLSTIIQKEKYISFDNFNKAVEKVYNYKYNLMPLFISLKTSLNINRNEKELEINRNNYNDYSKILKEVFAGYKKQGDIGNSNFDFKSNLESDKRRPKYNNSIFNNINSSNSNQIKTGYLIMNLRYSSVGNISYTNNNSSIIGNLSSQNIETNNNNISLKKNKPLNMRYNVYYNKICGLEVFPAKFKEVEKDYKETINSNKIKRAKTKDNKKNISQGYMNMVEILDEISFLINKQKRINSEGIELAKDWKEIKEENEKYYEKIKDPNVMISVTSLKPYIFEDIFQKKLHGVQGNNI